MEIPEGKEKNGTENLFKRIMAKKFSNAGRDLDIQGHAAQRSSIGFNSREMHDKKPVSNQRGGWGEGRKMSSRESSACKADRHG